MFPAQQLSGPAAPPAHAAASTLLLAAAAMVVRAAVVASIKTLLTCFRGCCAASAWVLSPLNLVLIGIPKQVEQLTV